MQHPLDVEQDGAERFLGILLSGFLGVPVQDQAKVLDVTAERMPVRAERDAVLPVVAGTQLAVGLLAVLVHVLAEALLDQGGRKSPRFVLALACVASRT